MDPTDDMRKHFEPDGTPLVQLRKERDALAECFAEMEREQREEYEDYVKRCGGVPISHVKP